MELITLVMRYGFGLEATTDTASTIGSLTGGVRIHHGYIGALLILVYLLARSLRPKVRDLLLVLGLSLVLSDAIHHFAVLWPIEGSPHFDLTYPTHPDNPSG